MLVSGPGAGVSSEEVSLQYSNTEFTLCRCQRVHPAASLSLKTTRWIARFVGPQWMVREEPRILLAPKQALWSTARVLGRFPKSLQRPLLPWPSRQRLHRKLPSRLLVRPVVREAAGRSWMKMIRLALG